MLPKLATDASEDDLSRTFGQDFRDAIVSLPVGEWQGPVESGFGLHLVKITRREDSRIPEWVEVRDRIEADLLYEGRKAAEDQFYAEVLPRYQVIYDEGVVAALEGRGGLATANGEE
jgi:parvulin-like peptidyl-prolyl isomerase